MPSFAHGSPPPQFVAQSEQSVSQITQSHAETSNQKPENGKPQPPTNTRQHYATCSLDCPDSCRVVATEDLATVIQREN